MVEGQTVGRFSKGGLAEAADEVKTGLRETKRAQWRGDNLSHPGGRGAVRPGQSKGWEAKKKQFNRENSLHHKINCSSSSHLKADVGSPSSSSGAGDGGGDGNVSFYSKRDFNLNFSSAHEDTDLDTIDLSLSSSSPVTTPPPHLWASSVQLRPHRVGLKNFGNSCYMNASLQALLGLKMFVTEVLAIKEMLSTGDDQGLLQVFAQLCEACNKGEVEQVNKGVREVKKVIEFIDKEFVGFKMQDASEFLGRVLDELSEKLGSLLSSISDIKDELNPVGNYFQHVKEEKLVCLNCKAESRCKSRNMSVWCDTVSSSMSRTRSMSLQQLLEQSLAEEVIERTCDKCGCKEATTSGNLVKLPKVLIIILKRYKYNEQEASSGVKISRPVEIPECLSLTRLVSDTVILPSCSLSDQVAQTKDHGLPHSPPVNKVSPHVATPTKFKGIEVEQVGELSDQERLEYAMYVSKKEDGKNRSMEKEDADLKAAMEASLNEDDGNDLFSERFNNEVLERTPRKRTYSQLGGGVFTHGDKLDNAMLYMKSKESDSGVVKTPTEKSSPRLRRTDEGGRRVGAVPRPKSKEEEEADFLRALELSRQEKISNLEEEQDDGSSQFDWAMEDLENNIKEEVASSKMGKPEHRYQLHSVVSHHGISATSGHYVADVFRSDGGGWYRYDDTRVSKTDGLSVRTGANSTNGYILSYLYQPLWQNQ